MNRTSTRIPSRLRARRIVPVTLLSLGLALGGVACGSDSKDTATNDATTTTAVAADPSTTAATGDGTAASSTTAATATTDPAASGTVDANEASIDELAAAFDAAGVPNADRWAREVDEYRPYSGTDDWAHLKQELSKYNIDQDTLDKILSVLTVS
jgi:hypothetical protein